MPSSTKVPLQVAGYNILPLSLSPLPSFPHAATHYLYLAPHQPKIPTASASRSIFLVNVPFDATELHIKHLLSAQIDLPAGRIEDIQFESQRRKGGIEGEPWTQSNQGKKSKKRKRGSGNDDIENIEGAALPAIWDRDLQTNGLTAVVLFVDRVSMEAALKAAKMTRYLAHHHLMYPDKNKLLESVNTYMTAFAAKEASLARLQTKQRQEVDADGFITVTRGGRTNPARQEVAQELAEKQKVKQKGLEDFYRFQSREKLKERAGELVRKFEEDKEKVRQMRAQQGRLRPE